MLCIALCYINSMYLIKMFDINIYKIFKRSKIMLHVHYCQLCCEHVGLGPTVDEKTLFPSICC